MSKINKTFLSSHKNRDVIMELIPTCIFHNKDENKWNLKYKHNDEIISDVWFDSIHTNSSYSCTVGREHNTIGWSALIYLEEPIKTSGAYPYSVNAEVHHYTCFGELISIKKSHVPLSGI